MPLKGRGSSTCLICDQSGILLPAFPKLIKEIRILFKSKDEYNNMLRASKMCLSCIGRFFQLFEFETIRDSDVIKGAEGAMCHLCLSTDIMSEHVKVHAIDALQQTRFSQDYNDSIECCFACYSSIKVYTDLKATLDEQRNMFLARITKCHVKIDRVPDDDSDADSIIFIPREPIENIPLSSDETPTSSQELQTQPLPNEEIRSQSVPREEEPKQAEQSQESCAESEAGENIQAQPVRSEKPLPKPVQNEEPPAQPMQKEEPPAQPVQIEEPPAQPVHIVEIPVLTESEAANIPSKTEQSTLPAELEVSITPPESIPTVRDDATVAPETPVNVELPPSAEHTEQESSSGHSSGAEAPPATKRARRNIILERIDFDQEQIEVIDKFTAIKNRRGANRSNDLKELPKKRKSLGNIKTCEEKVVVPKKKRRHSLDWKNVAPHSDAMMDHIESQPEELTNASETVEEPSDSTEIDEILKIVAPPTTESPELTHDNAPAENQIVDLESPIKIEGEKKTELKTKMYKNLREKLQKAKGDKVTAAKSQEILKYGTEAITANLQRLQMEDKRKVISTNPKKQKKNLKKCSKSGATKAAPPEITVQEEIQISEEIQIETNKDIQDEAVLAEIAETISEINSLTPRSGSEIIEITTSEGDSSFAADQAQFDANNSNDYALFPPLHGLDLMENILDDPFNFGAEVIISEQVFQEPVIPLQDDDPIAVDTVEVRGRPTAEEIFRFGIKPCSVVVERLPPMECRRSPSANEFQRSPSVKAAERFTKSGRKCLVPKRLIDDANDSDEDFEPPVKQKKAKKGFTLRIVPYQKPTKKIKTEIEDGPNELTKKPKPKKPAKTEKIKSGSEEEPKESPKPKSKKKSKSSKSKKPRKEKSKSKKEKTEDSPESQASGSFSPPPSAAYPMESTFEQSPNSTFELSPNQTIEIDGELNEFTPVYVEYEVVSQLPETHPQIPHPRFTPPIPKKVVKTYPVMRKVTLASKPRNLKDVLTIRPFRRADDFPANSHSTTVEFLAPKYKHKGTVFIERETRHLSASRSQRYESTQAMQTLPPLAFKS